MSTPEHNDESHIGCCRPGMTMDATTVEQLPDGTWLAVAPIGSIFGAEVTGECRGEGATREEALAALKKDRDQVYEALWA